MNGVFDRYLKEILFAREPRLLKYDQQLAEFRGWVLTEVDAQANYTDRYAPPSLQTYDRNGNVINCIVSNPVYDAQHQEAYRRGIIGLPYSERAPHLLSFAMGYLLSQADISLHCPVTLTGAVAYVLGFHADESLRKKYLSELTRMDGQTKSGGTWATEIHGGSDVGATTTKAIPLGGRFALHGLKWFTSNANSGLALATARPEGADSGSSGLGLYLVPSHREDGSANRYLIRRLKDKFGTKGLPTGEIELQGAEAIEVAGPPNGFKLMMEALEYSRVHNAVGAAGVQRRALMEAVAWCKSRDAFGNKLIQYPMIQDELLRLQVRFQAGALLAFEAAFAFDQTIEDLARRTWLRLVTAMAKYLTAEYAIQSCRASLEMIGGNGYTSDYPIARIYRDAQVLTVWEGPANIQALELIRLLAPKYAGTSLFEQRIQQVIGKTPSVLAQKLERRLKEDRSDIEKVIADSDSSARYARKLLHRLSESLASALLCEHAATTTERNELDLLSAECYFEELEAPRIGNENKRARKAAVDIIEGALGATPSAVSISH